MPGKIVALSELLIILADRRRAGEKVVFTNGCFDIIHVGHIRCLRQARALGDILVVGVNSDSSVRALKGPPRPLMAEGERLEVVAALEFVDYVVLFDEPTPLSLITEVKPDILVKGGDYLPHEVVGREEVEAAGGRIEIVPYVEGASTSRLIERLRSRL